MTEIGERCAKRACARHIDISEIEAKTKIRAKYLRALENEEWGLLPGPTFVKSFLRTYAQALGLDAKALVEEYRLNHERPSEAMLEPIVSSPQGARSRPPGTGRTPGGGPSRGVHGARWAWSRSDRAADRWARERRRRLFATQHRLERALPSATGTPAPRRTHASSASRRAVARSCRCRCDRRRACTCA